MQLFCCTEVYSLSLFFLGLDCTWLQLQRYDNFHVPKSSNNLAVAFVNLCWRRCLTASIRWIEECRVFFCADDYSVFVLVFVKLESCFYKRYLIFVIAKYGTPDMWTPRLSLKLILI